MSNRPTYWWMIDLTLACLIAGMATTGCAPLTDQTSVRPTLRPSSYTDPDSHIVTSTTIKYPTELNGRKIVTTICYFPDGRISTNVTGYRNWQ